MNTEDKININTKDLNNNFFKQERPIYNRLNNNNKNLKKITDNNRYERFNQTQTKKMDNFHYIQPEENDELISQNININIHQMLNSEYLNSVNDIGVNRDDNTNIENYNETKFQKEIIKVFIYIYYYEKALSEKNIFVNKENYYLINPKWISDFKSYYSYNNVKKILESKEKINNDLIDSEIDNVIDMIIKKVKLPKKPLTYGLQPLNPNLIRYINNNDNNILFIKNGIIFPSKIMHIIKNIHPEIKHCLKKILIFKNEYIYYINKEKIIVGIFRYSALFIPSYVFIYKSLELEKEEAKIMLSLNINEYLKKRNCDVQSENQILKNENGEEIGSFIKQSQKNKKTVKKNFPSERNSKIINNENLINKTSNNNKDFNTIEAKQKKKKSELINKNNNPNIRKNLENLNNNKFEEINLIKEKDFQREEPKILNNNIESDINKKDYNTLPQSQNESIPKINLKEFENFGLKINNKKLISIKNVEREIVERNKNNFPDLNFNINNLTHRHKQLLQKKDNLQNENLSMIKEIAQLNDKLKQYEEKISSQKDLINKNNNQINILQQELQKKEENNKIINEKLKEKNDIFISKDAEINNLKEEVSKLKKNEANLLDMKEMHKKLEKEKKDISQQYKLSINKNKIFESQIFKLNEEKKELLEKITHYEENMSNQMDLINNINNLNKQIDDLKKKLKQKDETIENAIKVNKQEIDQIKNEKNILENKCKAQNNEINKLMNTIREMKINKANINKSLEKNISDLKKQKEKLIKDIKQYEEQISDKKEILRKTEKDIKIKNQSKNDINIISNIYNQINQNDNNINIMNEQCFIGRNEFQFNPSQNISNQISFSKVNNIIPNPNLPMNNQFHLPVFNNNQILHFNSINMIECYSTPPLIGLKNIGSSCYKNSVLQCLSQTSDLVNFFLKESNKEKIMNNNIAKKNKNELQLCPIFFELIKNLWKKDAPYKSFSPENFLKAIGAMINNEKGHFTLHESGEAKDFILFILERIHKELKKPIENKNLFSQINSENILNCYDKNNAFAHFTNEFQNETSIISDTFYGFTETTNVCQFCKNYYNSNGQLEPICYNYGIFNILIFPLEEVRRYRDQFNKVNNSNMVNLLECFLYNQKSDYFTGDNKNYCKICEQLFDSVNTTKIYKSPNVLILLFNRGKSSNIKIDFSNELDISNFVLNKNNREIYYLYAVVTHIEENEQNGHFIAICKSPINCLWYRYNDDIVEPINNFQKDVHDFGTPYFLFYQKEK